MKPASSRFPDLCSRGVRESHKDEIKSIKLCPFPDCENLFLTAGFNQLSLYDCMNCGNYMDLVSIFHNLPPTIDDFGNEIDESITNKIATTNDENHYNGKNPYAFDSEIMDGGETPAMLVAKQMHTLIDKKPQLFRDVSFNDVAWLNHLENDDLWWLGACNDGNIYVISQAMNQCILQFPGMLYVVCCINIIIIIIIILMLS